MVDKCVIREIKTPHWGKMGLPAHKKDGGSNGRIRRREGGTP